MAATAPEAPTRNIDLAIVSSGYAASILQESPMEIEQAAVALKLQLSRINGVLHVNETDLEAIREHLRRERQFGHQRQFGHR